nr:hypothetical protein CFP56_50383 [Quercus suber]
MWTETKPETLTSSHTVCHDLRSLPIRLPGEHTLLLRSVSNLIANACQVILSLSAQSSGLLVLIIIGHSSRHLHVHITPMEDGVRLDVHACTTPHRVVGEPLRYAKQKKQDVQQRRTRDNVSIARTNDTGFGLSPIDKRDIIEFVEAGAGTLEELADDFELDLFCLLAANPSKLILHKNDVVSIPYSCCLSSCRGLFCTHRQGCNGQTTTKAPTITSFMTISARITDTVTPSSNPTTLTTLTVTPSGNLSTESNQSSISSVSISTTSPMSSPISSAITTSSASSGVTTTSSGGKITPSNSSTDMSSSKVVTTTKSAGQTAVITPSTTSPTSPGVVTTLGSAGQTTVVTSSSPNTSSSSVTLSTDTASSSLVKTTNKDGQTTKSTNLSALASSSATGIDVITTTTDSAGQTTVITSSRSSSPSSTITRTLVTTTDSAGQTTIITSSRSSSPSSTSTAALTTTTNSAGQTTIITSSHSSSLSSTVTPALTTTTGQKTIITSSHSSSPSSTVTPTLITTTDSVGQTTIITSSRSSSPSTTITPTLVTTTDSAGQTTIITSSRSSSPSSTVTPTLITTTDSAGQTTIITSSRSSSPSSTVTPTLITTTDSAGQTTIITSSRSSSPSSTVTPTLITTTDSAGQTTIITSSRSSSPSSTVTPTLITTTDSAGQTTVITSFAISSSPSTTTPTLITTTDGSGQMTVIIGSASSTTSSSSSDSAFYLRTDIGGGFTFITVIESHTYTAVSGGSDLIRTVTGSITSTPDITSTMTNLPPGISLIDYTGSVTGDEWCTTTDASGSPTIVPIILPCATCQPVIIIDLPEIPQVEFQLPKFPELPSFHLPCIKIFGIHIAGDCDNPPSNADPPPSPRASEGPSTTPSTLSTASSTTTSSSSSSSSCSAQTVSQCTQTCSFGTNSVGSTTVTSCASATCTPTSGCSVSATTITSTTADACSFADDLATTLPTRPPPSSIPTTSVSYWWEHTSTTSTTSSSTPILTAKSSSTPMQTVMTSSTSDAISSPSPTSSSSAPSLTDLPTLATGIVTPSGSSCIATTAQTQCAGGAGKSSWRRVSEECTDRYSGQTACVTTPACATFVATGTTSQLAPTGSSAFYLINWDATVEGIEEHGAGIVPVLDWSCENVDKDVSSANVNSDAYPYSMANDPPIVFTFDPQHVCNENNMTFTYHPEDSSFWVTSKDQGGRARCTEQNFPSELKCDTSTANVHDVTTYTPLWTCLGDICGVGGSVGATYCPSTSATDCPTCADGTQACNSVNGGPFVCSCPKYAHACSPPLTVTAESFPLHVDMGWTGEETPLSTPPPLHTSLPRKERDERQAKSGRPKRDTAAALPCLCRRDCGGSPSLSPTPGGLLHVST